MAKRNMVQALNQALALELERNPRVLICGEDVGYNGGVFRVTDGLQERFGERRVFDTPLAESGIVGTAVGMAIYGVRPVVEIQFAGFSFVSFNQIVSQATRMRFRSVGNFTVPLVIRAPFGGGVRTPELHSDSVEAFYMHAQGMKVVIPATPYEAKGLLHSAIADPDPVLFLEHMKLYRSIREEVPDDYYTIPLGQARVVQPGEDVTVVAYGAMVNVATAAAEQLAAERNVTVEVLDLRTLAPLDEESIEASVRKTGRCVIVHEASRTAGPGAEIAALLQERCLYHLLAPVQRVTIPDAPFPVPAIEDHFIPTPERVAEAMRRTLEM